MTASLDARSAQNTSSLAVIEVLTMPGVSREMKTFTAQALNTHARRCAGHAQRREMKLLIDLDKNILIGICVLAKIWPAIGQWLAKKTSFYLVNPELQAPLLFISGQLFDVLLMQVSWFLIFIKKLVISLANLIREKIFGISLSMRQ